jgi:hypothetical protein
MTELEEIMGFLGQVAASGTELRLVNVYKGVPISFPAKILEVGRSSIRVKTEKYQLVCLYKERVTILSSSLLPRGISARVIMLDVGKLEVMLAKFSVANYGAGARNQVRVEPENPIEGIIRAEITPLSISGELADISQDGLGVFISQNDFFPEIHRKGVGVRIYARLPVVSHISGKKIDLAPLPRFEVAANFDGYSVIQYDTKPEQREYPVAESGDLVSQMQEVVIHGSIVNIRTELQARRHRLGIHINDRDPAKAVITRFISRRQSELTREIKSMYELLQLDNNKMIT